MHLIHPLHPLLTLLTLLTPSATSTLLRLTSHCDRPYYYVFTTPNISAEAPPNTFTSTPVTKINSTLPSFEHVLEGQGQQLGISDTENYWTGKQWILGLNTEVESLGAEERVGRRVWWNVNFNNASPFADPEVAWNVTTTGLETSAQCGNATEYNAAWMHNCIDGEDQVLGVHLCSKNL